MNIKSMLPIAKTLVASGAHKLIEHKDVTLAAFGVAGLFISVGMALKAGPVIKEELENAEADKYEREYDKLASDPSTAMALDDGVIGPARIHEWAEERMKLTTGEKAKIIFRYLWPTALSTGLTTMCIIGSNRVSAKRNAALVAAYTLSEANLKDLQDKIVETDGPKKLKSLEDAIMEERIKRNPPPTDKNLIINTGDGVTLCQDYYTGRYFYSDAEKIRQAILRFGKKIQSWSECSQNEWYDEINLPHIPSGDNNVITDYMIESRTYEGFLEPDFTSVLSENDIPVLVVCLNVDFKPKYAS